jgi:hypothetical protein
VQSTIGSLQTQIWKFCPEAHWKSSNQVCPIV